MDARLDRERRDGGRKRAHRIAIDDLPDGAMFADGERAFAVKGDSILEWSFAGYLTPRPRPRGLWVEALTPPTSIQALSNGYAPQWHHGAG